MLRYERARDPWSVEEEAALLAPPLLQLAVTTRSEVTTLSRILLEQHADGIRRSRAKTWLKALPGKHAAALLHVAEQSEGNVVDGGGITAREPFCMVCAVAVGAQLVKERAQKLAARCVA